MFQADWIEKYFSRVRPWQIVALWVPFGGWCVWRQAEKVGTTAGGLAATLLAGVLLWTFMEYVLHRFVFHFKPREKSEAQRDIAYLIHGVHHDYPWDGDRLVMPPVAAIVIAVFLWVLASALFGFYAFSGMAGIVAGYVWYDLTHYYLHHGKPTTRWGKWARRYHLLHHFATPNRRYGITSPLWDLAFGTYPREPADPRETSASEPS